MRWHHPEAPRLFLSSRVESATKCKPSWVVFQVLLSSWKQKQGKDTGVDKSHNICRSTMHEKVKVTQLCPTLWPNGLYSPWNSPGQNTGVGSRSLLQCIFLTQELNCSLLHCRQIPYQLSYQGSPMHAKYFNISFLLIYFTLQYCIGFAIHCHTLTWEVLSFQWTKNRA